MVDLKLCLLLARWRYILDNIDSIMSKYTSSLCRRVPIHKSETGPFVFTQIQPNWNKPGGRRERGKPKVDMRI